MSDAANVLSTIESAQVAFSVIQTLLGLTAYNYPPTCTPENDGSYDFIIVGGGTAGCVLASRLTEYSNVSVLLIESGGYPPIESSMPGLLTLLPQSAYDYDFVTVNDNYTSQNLQGSVSRLTQGKMLGGSSSLNHMMYEQGNEDDFQSWATLAGDDSWNYTNILPYFIKMEQLYDAEILNSSFAKYHGTSGYIKVARILDPINGNYLKAMEELGYKTKIDLSGESSLGYSETMYTIGDGVRQNNALAYLRPAKLRPNLCLALNSTATKILINNNTATGVQMVDSSGNTIIVNAAKEVLVSAGTINSPKILMLSGIGPKAHLEEMGIEVVKDLPVGENFQDNISAATVYQTEASTERVPSTNSHEFGIPVTNGYLASDGTQTYPDYQTVNLVYPHDSTAQIHLCSKVFKYTNDICQKFFDASKGRSTLFAVQYLLKPSSRGNVKLTSSDYKDAPTIYTGAYSNSSDLTLMGKRLKSFNEVLNTTFFKSVNASLVDPGVCSGAKDSEYWECYALAMSSTTWHYCGTCAMGSVVDSSLKVKGVNALRVVDSSAMPTLTSSKIAGPVTALSEKAAELILSEWNIA